MFDELLKLTPRRIFIAGQNLYTLLVARGVKNRELLFDFLKRDKSRKAQIMVCDPDFKPGVVAWTKVTAAPAYGRDLDESIRTLEKWVAEAQDLGLNLEARKTEAVPVSITFLDPEEPDGTLYLIPNIYQEAAGGRACFFMYLNRDE